VGDLTALRKVVVLGSTGSIGLSTLDLFDKSGTEVDLLALTGGANVARLAEQARRWRPKLAVIADEGAMAN
jgi:1-deoxy-D-xylulose-5-phosphate reductoisomerase